MPRTCSTKPPSYRLHKASQQAVCTIKGRDHYLGAWQSPESRLKYERLITTWMAGDAATPAGGPLTPAGGPEASPADCTIAELCLFYLRNYAEKRYTKNGRPTSEIVNIRRAIRCLTELYAALPVKQFRPDQLEACRDKLVADGLSRSNVNRYASIMTRIIRYGVRKHGIPSEVWWGLKAVDALKPGESDAPDHPPIGPVSDEDVEATLPFLSEPYRAMVKLQGLLGCRPGELTSMQGGDIDRSDVVWIYKPRSHKTQHHGKERVIPIGPQAQLVLRPFLPDFPAQLVFRNNRRRVISRNSYELAIKAACRKAGIEPWSPNQLRHAAATRIRRQYGLEAAQVVLGHSTASTTEIYAERNIGLACDIALKLG